MDLATLPGMAADRDLVDSMAGNGRRLSTTTTVMSVVGTRLRRWNGLRAIARAGSLAAGMVAEDWMIRERAILRILRRSIAARVSTIAERTISMILPRWMMEAATSAAMVVGMTGTSLRRSR